MTYQELLKRWRASNERLYMYGRTSFGYMDEGFRVDVSYHGRYYKVTDLEGEEITYHIVES
jgi:hypothetical protein